LLPASYHTNLGLIPGESIQDLWWTKCPGTDSSAVVRFPRQYHSTTIYLRLRAITTRNTTGQTLETFWKKKQRSFRSLETMDRKVFWFPPLPRLPKLMRNWKCKFSLDVYHDLSD
jgi:hypothetical protein